MGILRPFYGCFAVDMSNLAVTDLRLRFFGWTINKLIVVEINLLKRADFYFK